MGLDTPQKKNSPKKFQEWLNHILIKKKNEKKKKLNRDKEVPDMDEMNFSPKSRAEAPPIRRAEPPDPPPAAARLMAR